MKLGKTAQLILVIGILAVLLVSAGVVYARQTVERSQLNSDIAQANQDFVRYTALKRELETRLSQAEAQLSSLQNEFYESTQSIEIDKTLFETADDANVSLTDISCSVPSAKTVNGIACQVFSLSLTVEGDNLAQLLNFTTKLGKRFPDATIESPRISISEERSTLNLKLTVYAL
jgi:septal ring factor EnvC (AmiA/AmiB activator)